MTRKDAARLGGPAHARALSPARRSAIAALGFAALVEKRFGGDRRAAIEGRVAAGLAAQDRRPVGVAPIARRLGRDCPPGRRPRTHAAPDRARGPPPGRGR